jgi:hypothetical protein
MRGATFFLAAAVLVGLVTSSARAADPHSRWPGDHGISVQPVGHPGAHHGHHPPTYGRHGYLPGYHDGARPYVIQPPIPGHPPVMVPVPGHPPVVVPYSRYRPVYPGHPHVCGPQCGAGCRHGSPHDSFYYRGRGWGFSFSF